jgi:hypothetical protein
LFIVETPPADWFIELESSVEFDFVFPDDTSLPFVISKQLIHTVIYRGCLCKKLLKNDFFLYIDSVFLMFSGPGSSVGIATGYGLDGPGIESRWG